MQRVLIAGVGNVFFRDDGFGVEVARRLSTSELPAGVGVVDFGIRGVHLAFDLLEPPELLIVVDLAPRGGRPGDLYVIEPLLDAAAQRSAACAHGMDLSAVFAQVEAMGGGLPPTRIVGCEPADVSEGMGLSAPVEEAVGRAAKLALGLAAGALPPRVEDESDVDDLERRVVDRAGRRRGDRPGGPRGAVLDAAADPAVHEHEADVTPRRADAGAERPTSGG